MTTVTINYKEGRGTLNLNLNELFYPTPLKQLKDKNRNRGDFYAVSDAIIERHTTAGRVKKLLNFLMLNRWNNEEAFTVTLSYVKSELLDWYKYGKIAYENRECQIGNSTRWKEYDKEIKECEKKFKLLNEALNILEETKIDSKDRIKIIEGGFIL